MQIRIRGNLLGGALSDLGVGGSVGDTPNLCLEGGQSFGAGWHEDCLRMANDAVPLPTSDVIHQYGRRNALHHPPIPEKINDGSFLAQVSGNPFFTAVGTPELRA